MPVLLFYSCSIRLVDPANQVPPAILQPGLNSPFMTRPRIPRLLKHVYDALCTLYLVVGASKRIFVMF